MLQVQCVYSQDSELLEFMEKLIFGSFLTGNRNAKFSYGYSSFKGKRSSMEDFYEASISEVDGQMVACFGVFDGKSLIPKYYLYVILLLFR